MDWWPTRPRQHRAQGGVKRPSRKAEPEKKTPANEAEPATGSPPTYREAVVGPPPYENIAESRGITEQTPAMDGPLPAESDEGSVEYKLFVIDRPRRVEGLKTQMNCRLMAGDGTATYWVGVMDDGTKVGISTEALEASIAVLRRVAADVGATVPTVEYGDVEGPPPTRVHRRLQDQIPSEQARRFARLDVVRAKHVPPPFYFPE